MIPILMSYFDLGVSYGLGDTALPPKHVASPDIGMVGLDPPIGHGMIETVPERIVEMWKEHAVLQAGRADVETGRPDPPGMFDEELAQYIKGHDIQRCQLTVYAIGTVFVELRFAANVERRFLHGLLECYEFAGYKPRVARALHSCAVGRVAHAFANPGDDAGWAAVQRGSLSSPLTKLTRRDLAPVDKDPDEQEPDGRPYEEQMLMPFFSQVLACTARGDEEQVTSALAEIDPTDKKRPVLTFEYHGQLHCGWAGAAVVARKLAMPDDPGTDTPENQIKRMLACLQVAHVHYGTCEAFERLFLTEIDQQVGGYLRNTPAGRQPEDLNRLRNLAIAVISLTRFSRVTETGEDQEYFKWIEGEWDIPAKRAFIGETADILYNVADAETQARRSRRETALNAIVLLLTSATLLSVSADAYDFIRANETLIDERVSRIRVLLQFLVVVALLVVVILYVVTRPRPVHRWRARRSRPHWDGFDDPTRPHSQ